jgi:uncharacterized membrane protein YeaQ/YmgE (transglycosylase-associated protein family)
MEIMLWIVIGIVMGAFARTVLPGPRAGGVPMGILLGICGALAGGGLGILLTGDMSFVVIDSRALLIAISTTLVVLLCYRAYALKWPEEQTSK